MANEVTLKVNEAQKFGVIQETLNGRMTVQATADILGLSDRQVYRLRERVRQAGTEGIVHGNRGRPPSQTKSTSVRNQVIALYEKKYEGYNFTHYAEALADE